MELHTAEAENREEWRRLVVESPVVPQWSAKDYGIDSNNNNDKIMSVFLERLST